MTLDLARREMARLYLADGLGDVAALGQQLRHCCFAL